jgi:anti-anti-sigma regulatory factor
MNTAGDLDRIAVVELGSDESLANASSEQTRERLHFLAGVAGRIVVDFSRTRTFDGALLGVLAAVAERLAARGAGRLVVCGLDEHARRLLQICRLDHEWVVRATLQDAFEGLGYPGIMVATAG